MSLSAQNELAGIAATLERRFGVHLCIYDYTGTMSAILPPHMSMHRQAFCRAVLGQHREQCQQFDYINTLRDFLTKRYRERNTASFIKRCHAGVAELVCPVIRNRTLAGAAIVGPMRWEPAATEAKLELNAWRRIPLLQEQTDLREQLPVLDDLLYADLCGLLAAIVARVEQLSIQNLSVSHSEMDRRWRVESLVARRFMFQLSLADVAQELAVSESRARHVFIELFGEPFSQYLRNVRLSHAEQLLTTTDLSVAQIAEAAGFNQSAYFHNVFRRCRKMTPLAYRKLHQAGHSPAPRGVWGTPAAVVDL